MLTGVTADRHGIFGNRIYDGERFRYANPDDVRVPTIARLAKEAGLHVASIGYTMTRPEDVTLFQPPWWIGDWIQRSRDSQPLPIDPGWQRALQVRDHSDQLSAVKNKNGSSFPALPEKGDWLQSDTHGMASDFQMMQWTTALACSESPPDLILTELNMTDEVQHSFGYASSEAHWSMASADMSVGMMLNELHRSGRDEDYVIVVTSDHGHSEIDTAIFPEEVIPAHRWESEGSVLHVVVEDSNDRRAVLSAFADHGVEEIPGDHVPLDLRDHLATLVAPARHAFEHKPGDLPGGQDTGPAYHRSSHGLRPGSPEDDRICIISGKDVPSTQIEQAEARQFASTLAHLLDLDPDRFELDSML